MQLTADEIALLLRDEDILRRLELLNERKAARVVPVGSDEVAALLNRARQFRTMRRDATGQY